MISNIKENIISILESNKGLFISGEKLASQLNVSRAAIWKAIKALKNEGYDSVGTRRVTRKGEPPIRSFFARMFYKIKILQVLIKSFQ